MTCRWLSSFRCPRMDNGPNYCWYGCTTEWPMCHMFQENTCYEQNLVEYCRKGWHVQQNDRRAWNHDTWEGASSTGEPPKKKARRAETIRGKREPKLETRLKLLGFYNSELPSADDLETAYGFYTKTLTDSAIANEEKQRIVKKLRSAFKNINKAIRGEEQSRSSTDSEDESLE